MFRQSILGCAAWAPAVSFRLVRAGFSGDVDRKCQITRVFMAREVVLFRTAPGSTLRGARPARPGSSGPGSAPHLCGVPRWRPPPRRCAGTYRFGGTSATSSVQPWPRATEPWEIPSGADQFYADSHESTFHTIHGLAGDTCLCRNSSAGKRPAKFVDGHSPGWPATPQYGTAPQQHQ